ncbi:MAG: hypothetical protein WA154_04085 [Moraxellaceae bacterium]
MWVDIVQLRPSRLQHAVCLLWWLLVVLFVIGAGLTVLVKVLAVLGLFAVAVLQQVWQSRQAKLLLLQQLDRSRWQWQACQIRSSNPTTRHKSERNTTDSASQRQIQARLLRVDAWLGMVVILRFEIIALGQSQTWLIWRDQVDHDNWRRLQVLQQYWAAPDPS